MPRGIRNAAFACLILSAAVGFMAASQTWSLVSPQEHPQAVQTPKAALSLSKDPALQKELEEKLAQAQDEAEQTEQSSLNERREVRALILTALSIACALTFVGASRMLRPFGLPREGVRRLLAGAALAAAILRTLDGAQLTAASRRAAATWARTVGTLPHVDETELWLRIVPRISGPAFIGVAMGQTLVIAGAFLFVSQYFRSERVKKIVQFRDDHPES
jgi:hypothetical protein